MQATYVSSNQLKVSEDKTEEFLAGRRIRALCGSDYKYSTIQSSTYSSPDTTIIIEESILTSDLLSVHYGIVNIGEQGSFPKHSHDGSEGTGGSLTLLTLSDTPSVYEEGEYLRSTTSGVEWTVPEAEATVIRVKEENVSVITKGQVCAIVGSSGVLAEIGLCDCDDPNKIRNIGIAQTDMLQNEDGVIVYRGIITGVDTRTSNTDVNPNGETWVPGDLLWVSATPGGMTNIRPTFGRSIKSARTVKGNSVTDILIVISHENTIWSTAAAGEDVVLRVGDSAGANKVSIREYTNSEVAFFDSYGNLTVSGTVDGVDVAVLKSDFDSHDHDDLYYTESEVDTISGTLQTNINTKSDTELFLTDGVPSDSIGKENDIVIDQDIGTVYKKVQDDVITTFYPAVSGDDVVVKDNGSFYSSIQLVVGEQNGSTSWSLSVRFPNVTIPNGVTITSVYIKFTAYNNQAGTVCNANCYFNDVDNAVAPINASEYNALVVTSPIAWNDISAWTDGTQYDTPELKTILQPVIDRAGWASGQAMQFLIKDNGSDTSARREMSSIDWVSGTEKSELHVTWSENVWDEKLSPDFLKLSDTPTTYSGIEGNYLRTTVSGITTVSGVILKASDDSEWLINVTTSGVLYTTAI